MRILIVDGYSRSKNHRYFMNLFIKEIKKVFF